MTITIALVLAISGVLWLGLIAGASIFDPLGRSPRQLFPIRLGLAFTLLVVAAILASIGAARAEPTSWPGPYAVSLVKVADGDTVVVRFAEGPCERGPCAGSIWSIRVAGIDTPEKRLCRNWQTLAERLPTLTPAQRTKLQSCAWCPAEKQAAAEAKAYASRLLSGHALRVSGLVRDPYWGRLVGSVELDTGGGEWRSLAEVMIEVGHAIAYDPGAAGSYAKVKPWCEVK